MSLESKHISSVLVVLDLVVNLILQPGHTRHHTIRGRPPRLQSSIENGEKPERGVLRERDLPAHYELPNLPCLRC